MNIDQIYQDAFNDELGKLAMRIPSPNKIKQIVNYGKDLKRQFDEKYGTKKKKKRKRSNRFSFFRK